MSFSNHLLKSVANINESNAVVIWTELSDIHPTEMSKNVMKKGNLCSDTPQP